MISLEKKVISLKVSTAEYGILYNIIMSRETKIYNSDFIIGTIYCWYKHCEFYLCIRFPKIIAKKIAIVITGIYTISYYTILNHKQYNIFHKTVCVYCEQSS